MSEKYLLLKLCFSTDAEDTVTGYIVLLLGARAIGTEGPFYSRSPREALVFCPPPWLRLRVDFSIFISWQLVLKIRKGN